MIDQAPLNAAVFKQLCQGDSLVVDPQLGLRKVTWGEHFIRFFNWAEAKRQDRDVTQYLIQSLNHAHKYAIDDGLYAKTLDAVSKFAKISKKSDETFKLLENTLFAHKCLGQLPSLKIEELIQKDGKATSNLLDFLKCNSLHYVIAKANNAHKETSLLIDENQIYIRSKDGKSFLDQTSHIDLILQRIGASHPHVSLLKELRNLLKNGKGNLSPTSVLGDISENVLPSSKDKRKTEIVEQLKSGHYCYRPLQEVCTDDKGMLLSQVYFADGIESFKHSEWDHLKPAFREPALEATYQLRTVIRLPSYALEKTRWGVITNIIKNIFDFRAHGHSWVEITSPVHNGKGEFRNEKDVFCVGYYFHPLDRYKRFESADPVAYMPVAQNQMIVKEINISQAQFNKIQLYVNEVQKLIKNPGRTLNDVPENKQLSGKEIEEIRYLYKSALKSTCLSFANTLKEIITGHQTDNRSFFLRWIYPKKEFKQEDNTDHFTERTFVLKHLIKIPRFLGRMELPFWVNPKQTPFKTN